MDSNSSQKQVLQKVGKALSRNLQFTIGFCCYFYLNLAVLFLQSKYLFPLREARKHAVQKEPTNVCIPYIEFFLL